MSKKNICLINSSIRTGVTPVAGGLLKPSYSNCLTLVMETKASRGFCYVVFGINHVTMSVTIYATSGVKVSNDKEVVAAITSIVGTYNILIDPSINIGLAASDLLLLEKLDDVLYSSNVVDVSPLSLNSRDTNNVFLNNYLSTIGTCMDEQGTPVTLTDLAVPVSKRKFGTRKRSIDWDKTWSSDKLTDAEKEALTCSPDLLICYANKDRDLRNIVERQLYAKYIDRDWVFNILHGPAGSGKTSMVMKDICALNHIPVYYSIGDPRASINRMLTIVSPSKQSDGKVELTEKESAWLKCMKYNLPLVVFFDEFATLPSLELKQLGTLITEAEATIGVNHYQCTDRCIFYFCAFNPGSKGDSEIPESTEDRAMWFSVPKVSLAEKKAYRAAGRMAVFNPGNLTKTLTDFESKLTALTTNDNLELINNIRSKISSINLDRCDTKSLQWYCDYLLASNPTIKPFKEGVFNNSYIDNIDSIEYSEQVSNRILNFYDKLNCKLAELTKGIQKTKLDRNSTITLSDRAYDVFEDLIFSFSSVEKATEFMVMNRLPGGFVLNVVGANKDAGKDNAAEVIWKSLKNYLDSDMQDLNTYLFKTNSNSTSDKSYEKYITNFVVTKVNSSNANQSKAPTSASDIINSFNEAPNNTIDSFADDIMDALDNL